MKYTKVFLLAALMALMLCSAAAAEDVIGCAFVDANHNGICDSGEQLISGVPVSLEKRSKDGWAAVAQSITDAYGSYLLDMQEAGVYRVKCQLGGQTLAASSVGGATLFEDGFAVSEPFDSPVQTDVALVQTVKVSIYAFRDSDGNGQIGKYERALSGIRAEVVDGENVLASGTSGKKGEIELTVVPGRWALRFTAPEGFDFTQAGKDSLIGSMGSSSVTSEVMEFAYGEEISAGVGVRPVGSFRGRAWEDMNNNGLMDEDEPGVAGVTVHLQGQRTGTSRSLTTNESGDYYFGLLPDDKYTVTADLPGAMLYARYSQTGGDLRSIFTGSIVSREFSVKSASSVTNKNIGVVQKGAIFGTAFFDLDYNGRMDEDEPGYKGVTVEVIKISTGDSMGRLTTGEGGAFRIENLRGGDYRLRAILPDDGSIFSLALEGAANEVNLFSQRPGRRENTIQPLTITSGGEAGALIGVARGASVSGTVFEDADYNGRKNGKEKALSGLKVRIEDLDGNVIATDTTDKKGQYTLYGILPGEYVVKVQRRASYGFTRLRPEEDGGSHITVLEGEYGVTAPMTIAMAEEIRGVNAGMLPGATLSGSFFHDVNDNGLWDEGEGGMLSGKVRLLSEDGEIDLYQTPGEDGSYFFDGVMPGKYTVTYILPEHCEMARTARDGNTVKHDGLETVTKSFSIKMGEDAERPLAGAVTLGSFDGFVYRDTNGNGVPDNGEARVAGAEIALICNEETFSAVSAADGSFSVRDLRPADYTLEIQLPDGLIFSSDLEILALSNVSSHSSACPWEMLTSRMEKHVGAVSPASISGVIWMDENQDGQRFSAEWIMEGVEVSLIDERTGQTEDTVVSNEKGFRFDSVRPSEYTVLFQLPSQSIPAEDSSSTFQLNGDVMKHTGITVSEGAQVDSPTTGLVSRTSIGGAVWLDETGDRTPVAGVTITLSQNGQSLQTAVSSEDGSYRFDGLWPGTYTLKASIPSGMIFVRPEDPNYASGASVIASEDGSSRSVNLLMAQHQLNLDVLCIKPAKVGDIAWLDENANGLVDGTEPRLPGVKVQLVQNGQTVYETVTDSAGYYRFAHVYPGEYMLKASAYSELAPTTPVEKLRIISSCLTSGDGLEASSDTFRVESGETNMNFDLGYVLLEGQTLPDAASAPAPQRDWTISNTKED